MNTIGYTWSLWPKQSCTTCLEKPSDERPCAPSLERPLSAPPILFFLHACSSNSNERPPVFKKSHLLWLKGLPENTYFVDVHVDLQNKN